MRAFVWTLVGLCVWSAAARSQGTPTPLTSVGTLSLTATRALDLRQAEAVINRMQRERSLRVLDVAADTVAEGRVHHRLAQYHHGVRVQGAGVSRQSNRGRTVSVFGRIYADVSLPVDPVLSAGDAIDVAARTGGRPTGIPELLVIVDPAAGYRLAYQVHTFGPTGLVESEVDALTGEIIQERNALRTQGPSSVCSDCAVGDGFGVKGDRKKLSVRSRDGVFRTDDGLRSSPVQTYDLRGDWNRTLDVLVGASSLTEADLARDADNFWDDRATVDGHAGSGWTLDYLLAQFGWKGLDGNGGPIVAIVHPIDRADFAFVPGSISDLFHLNAFFCPTCGPFGTIVFGEGLPAGEQLGRTGKTVEFFVAGLDIVAHELAHAVTEFSSQLIYQGESGALNEAFSDLIGVGTEFFMAETGRHGPEQADYVVGEDVVKPTGIRSLSNPRSQGDPDHYSLRFLGQADNGGVHTNSTIATHAYYLAVEGGTNLTSGVQVSGLGSRRRQLVEQIFYRAFVFLLPQDATFSMARAATLQSARDLSEDPDVEQTIARAWTAVGVE